MVFTGTRRAPRPAKERYATAGAPVRPLGARSKHIPIGDFGKRTQKVHCLACDSLLHTMCKAIKAKKSLKVGGRPDRRANRPAASTPRGGHFAAQVSTFVDS